MRRARDIFSWLILAAGALAAGAATPVPGLKADRIGTIGMVRIPEGIFVPPFSKDSTLQYVVVPGFRIDPHPVTSSEFAGFVLRRPEWRRSRSRPLFKDAGYLRNWKDDTTPADGDPAHPVTYVSWHAAKAYCADVGKRLPTTMEWERVAATRAADYDSLAMTKDILDWYGRPAGMGVGRLGSGSRNGFGVSDMHGLVWEWTSDYRSWGFATFGKAAEDSARFCGGGGNRGNSSDYILYMRYGFRSSLEPHFVVAALGFRCAADLPRR